MAVRDLLDSILALLFPDRCAGCAGFGSLFCASCRATLAPYPGAVRQMPAGLSDLRIAYIFQSPLREAVHQLKYRKRQRVAQPLGQLMAEHIVARPVAADAVLAIPLHARRLAERGFNQAEALAREIARLLDLPLLDTGLVRVRATEQQARLDARARAENMREAFAWRGSPPPSRLLLVDDVLTTGATMGACAVALRDAGARDVYGLALARSRPDMA
ncbi:MAG TPA: ComF family protein [Roseiflexaceae bacterium]|nr:ComF family protein [Roseiflexaceae bacterium]